MILFIDTFNNSIKVFRAESKKEIAYYFEQSFDFDLSKIDNKYKAISLFMGSEGADELKKSKNNQLILSDDLLGLGYFELILHKRQNYNDIFLTKFGLQYPEPHANYYFEGFEFDRNDKFVYYNYSFAKREYINQITTILKNGGVSIGDRNVFASTFAIRQKNVAPYPISILIVGKYNSELLIVKGERIISINVIGYGSEALLDGNNYMYSAYYNDNEKALKFASFIKNHIVVNEEVNDINISNADPSESLNQIEPKEIRLLKEKEEQLTNYNVHNNFRKFYARILEITDLYTRAPWFFPLKEINVIADVDVMSNLLDVAREDDAAHFVAVSKTINDYAELGIVGNPMYLKGIKKERRKFDWNAFLNMEIGGKKKKA